MLSIKLVENLSEIPEELHSILISSASNLTYLMYLHTEVIGWGQVLLHPNEEYELANIMIKPAFRNNKYGQKLVKFIIYNAPFRRILATTITPDFFYKLGFRKLDKHSIHVDHSHPDCQKCDIKKCTPLAFEKSDVLLKYDTNPAIQEEYYSILKSANPMICEFSAVNNKIWGFPENPYFIKIKEYLFLVYFPFERDNYAVIPPYKKIPADIINGFFAKLKLLGINKLQYLTDASLHQLESSSPVHFNKIPNPANFDYLYKVSDFADYAGAKFEKKRNRLKKFIKTHPDHQLLTYDLQYNNEILEFVGKVCPEQQIAPIYCTEVMQKGFKENLLSGFFVKVANQIVGCLFYSELNPKTVVIHFELMNWDYDGVAQLMNNHLGKILSGKYLYINRENDLGLEGLRKSKLSYRPYRILKKYDVLLN